MIPTEQGGTGGEVVDGSSLTTQDGLADDGPTSSLAERID
jgi:hypothetical protein